MGASGGVFSPSCDASHLHPAPLQQHQAAQGRPGHHSSSAAGAVLFARADRLLLGSDLPRGSLGAAPALGRLGPSPAGGLRPSTHSRLLGLRGSGRGEHQKGMTHTAMPGQQAGKAPSNRRTLAGVQQSGPAGCRYTTGRISSNRPLGSPRSQRGEQVCSPNAVRRQHGSFSRATGPWLAGRCETPPQHAPAARTSKG